VAYAVGQQTDHTTQMTCAMDARFWDSIYRHVVFETLTDFLYADYGGIDPRRDHGELLGDIDSLLESLDDRYEILKNMIAFVEYFRLDETGSINMTTLTDDDRLRDSTVHVIDGLIADMQGTESISSLSVLSQIQSVYEGAASRATGSHWPHAAAEEMDSFVFRVLFYGKKKYIPTLHDLIQNHATFSRQAVDRYFRTAPPRRIPIAACIALVYWKHQVNLPPYGGITTTRQLERSWIEENVKISEKFAKTIRPYAGLCGANVNKLYSFIGETDVEQEEQFKKRIYRKRGHASYEAILKGLLDTHTDEARCIQQGLSPRTTRRLGNVPVLFEYDTSLVQQLRHFIDLDQLIGRLGAGGVIPDPRKEVVRHARYHHVMVIPGLVVRYLDMQKKLFQEGFQEGQEGYKITAEFDIAGDNADLEDLHCLHSRMPWIWDPYLRENRSR